MKNKQKLIVECCITVDGTDYVWEDLPENKKNEYRIKMTENCRKALTEFYIQNQQYICSD